MSVFTRMRLYNLDQPLRLEGRLVLRREIRPADHRIGRGWARPFPPSASVPAHPVTGKLAAPLELPFLPLVLRILRSEAAGQDRGEDLRDGQNRAADAEGLENDL